MENLPSCTIIMLCYVFLFDLGKSGSGLLTTDGKTVMTHS